MRLFFHTAVLSSIMVALSSAQTIFSDAVPTDYYSRKDLSDCSARFDTRIKSQANGARKRCFIAGGRQVRGTEMPHMAVLGWSAEGSDTGIRWKCGGSLITERYVLTAAHCVADSNNNLPRFVRLGDVDLASVDDDKYAQQYEILRIIRHPSHRFSQKYFDLALIELNGTVRITVGVCPACLWTKQVQPHNEYVAAGYGETSYGSGSIPNLLKATLYQTDRETCTATYQSTRGLSSGIAVDQMCASNGESDTCQGDSGGPLQVTLGSFNQLHPFIVGVTSFGRGCGSGSSGVYQLLADHIPWIESVVNETLDSSRCIQKYSAIRLRKDLISSCAIRSGYVSRVRLLWPEGSPGPLGTCTGTLIDYNTVITSARCAQARGSIAPIEVEIKVSQVVERAKIVKIQIHPDFQEPSYRNDLALLRLDKYLQPTDQVSASCVSVPEPSVICSDRQTHDRVACWDQFVDDAKMKLLQCNDHEKNTIKAHLIWGDESQSPCDGMLIRSDTILTSISCMNEHSKIPPVAVRLENNWRLKIDRILKHPGFDPSKPREHDTALVLLELDYFDRTKLLPFCVREVGNGNPLTYISAHDPEKPIENGDNIYVPAYKRCSDPMAANLTGLFDETLSNGTRYMCWDVNRQVVPGVVMPEPGAGLLDNSHRFIRGVNTYSADYGSVEPVVSTTLVDYIDWITQFVLHRGPQESIVFRNGDDEFENGSPCTTPSGRQGVCTPDHRCRREIQRHKVNSEDVVFCGYEGAIRHICCPPEHQDIS